MLGSLQHMATVGTAIEAIERRYPTALASDWDSVGLVCGEPAASVHRILLAVDPVIEVVDEALLVQADLVITHHPLFLAGAHGVAADDPRGRIVHELISHGIALYAARGIRPRRFARSRYAAAQAPTSWTRQRRWPMPM